ncbi:MAG: serine hydroxymethyltransferase [Dethiobacteria bacterium]
MPRECHQLCDKVHLGCSDPQIAAAIAKEQRRQEEKIELIASENIVSKAVLEAQGSILTNKYAEGYPGARYYGGCTYVDEVEELARQRAVELFKAEHANVQPHAGAPANLAVFYAVLEPGDRVLGMGLSDGGHLTHGSSANISGKYFTVSNYGVDRESGYMDMEEVRRIALKTRPRLIVAGASAYPRTIDFKKFHEIADECGAYLLADIAHIAGLVVTGLHPSPIEHADFVTSTTHKTMRGPRGGIILCRRKFAPVIDRAVFPGVQGGPLMHIIAAKAVAFKEAMSPEFAAYQRQVLENARVLAEELMGYGFNLITGGTDNHLVLVDLRNTGITGSAAEMILEDVGVTANKNAIPYDPQPHQITSGIRLGTPAITTRGMGADEVRIIAAIINKSLRNPGHEDVMHRMREKIVELCAAFPLP